MSPAPRRRRGPRLWLGRIRHGFVLWLYVTAHLFAGTFRNLGETVRQGDTPMIVEMPLRASSDFEIFLLASLITAVPDSVVLGTAAAIPGGPQGDQPATLFVYVANARTRHEALAILQDLEVRVLRATRGGR